MRLHGRVAEHELLGYLAVRQPARHESEHLGLARRQLGERIRRRRGRRGARELLDEALGDAGSDQRVAARDDTNSGDEVLGRRVLQQESACARAERVVDVRIEIEGRQHQHRRPVASGIP